MKTILLSIKPKYADQIFAGTKKYEFRRKFPIGVKNRVLVYSSSPIKKVIGYFDTGEIIVGPPNTIWNDTHLLAGIDDKSFFEYFAGTDKALAISILNPVLLVNPCELYQFGVKNAPQSYMYL